MVNKVKGNGSELLSQVKFHVHTDTVLQGKVDTGAMATCMPVTFLKKLNVKIEDLQPCSIRLRSITGADMKTCGSLITKVTSNSITKTVRVIITELGTELILGLDFCKDFQLITISNSCIQRSITVEQEVRAVQITEEGASDYNALRKKWKKHLPLGKKTGDPLDDLKHAFPDMFDGKVGLFKGEVDLKVTPDAKPVQLPPRAVPISYLPKLKAELDKMEKEGIIRPCPETTDWVHNLVLTVKW